MRIVHVFLHGNIELVGQIEGKLTDDITVLKKAVLVNYIMTQQGQGRQMKSIEKDKDYMNGDIFLNSGSGAMIIHVNENGDLAKQYFETISNLVKPKLIMDGGRA